MNIPPPPFGITALELTYICCEAMHLPRWKGAMVRGGFGRMLRAMDCLATRADPEPCHEEPLCAYRAFFDPPMRHPHPDFGTIGDPPRPYVICAPLDTQTAYQAGDQLAFRMLLIGSAREHMLPVIGAWTRWGSEGLGPQRGRATLDQLHWIDPITGERKLIRLARLSNCTGSLQSISSIVDTPCAF